MKTKKGLKKLAALVLALCMCMGLCATTFGATSRDDESFSITISNATIGNTYTAYKIFDVTYDGEGNYAYTIKSTDDWFSSIVSEVTADADGVYTTSVFKLTPTSTTDGVTTYNVERAGDSVTDADIISFLNAAIADYADYDSDGNFIGWSVPDSFTAAASGTATAETLVIDLSDSGAGYYFVTTSSGSIVSITTTDPDAYIMDKNGGITLEKDVVKGLDTDDSMHGDTEAMGDDVEFTVNADVPLYAPGDAKNPEGYLVTDYEFADHMSAGLEIRGLTTVDGANADSDCDYYIVTDSEGITHYYATISLINQWITVSDGTNEYNLTDVAYNVVLELTYPTDYTDDNGDAAIQFDGFTLSYDTIDMEIYDIVVPKDDNGTALGFDTAYELVQAIYAYMDANGINYTPYPANASIVIDYVAHVTEDAEYDNTNEIDMTYHMTPYRNPNPKDPEYDGSRHDDDDIYVLSLTLLKVDGADETKVLEGAKFTLEGTNLNDVVTNTSETYTALESHSDYEAETAKGTELWFEVAGGTYTNVDPYDLDAEEDADELAKFVVNPYYDNPQYPDASDYPYVAYTRTISYSSGLQSASDKTVTGTTDENGVLSFVGLTEGEWTLTEIVAPDGYNLLDESYMITISVGSWSVDTDTGKVVPNWSVTGENSSVFSLDVSTGIISVTVENNSGTILPGTGGMGTTIFYIIGIIIVAGAAILLVTRRRVNRAA